MKILSMCIVFAAGGIVGWGAHTTHPEMDTKCPKEITVRHPDPDDSQGSIQTKVRLFRVGDTDLGTFPADTKPDEYWVITINGVHHRGVGRENPRLAKAR